MQGKFLKNLHTTLRKCIDELDTIHSLYVQNPDKDFTRNRKITFSDTFWFMIGLQGKSMPNEVLDFFDHSVNAPTSSAFIQQRKKILTEAWDFLYHSFEQACSYFSDITRYGYHIYACDGSDVNICRNPDDEETFIHEGEKGYNAIHINALYDLLSHTYRDVVFQGKKKLHERSAFNSMIDRYHGPAAIFTADRGYESFNTFAHVMQAGQKFLIRMKDIDSNGILSAYNLPAGEFDSYIETTLTRRHTKETTGHPEIYTILSPKTDFDFLDCETQYYKISFRIVRFKVGSGYVCVATNLPVEEFPPDLLRQLYRLRWSEESSFRELKYTIGLVNFHSKTKELILQEIYARLILYNFCELVVSHAVVQTRGKTKHPYKINFATAVNICKEYLKHGGGETEKMLLIQKHLTPIRPDRKYPLNLRPKRNRDFMYRAA
ncbi:MAG: IS4 family transposase [Oscillospiraceae bacterium]|nr:IS4 family transposase [Oscillospiraceae bacterium]